MQQINLLNPALIKKSDFLNPNNIAILLGVLVIGLFGYAWMEHHTLSQLQQSKEQLAKQISNSEKQLTEMRDIQAKKNDVSAQLKQIQALEQKIAFHQQTINAIGLNKMAQTQSYAEILKAFSRQSFDGLWITGLSIDQNAEVLSIKGRTVDANLLPKFIANLRGEPALKGKTFTDLTMESNQQSNAQEKNQTQKIDSKNIVSVTPANALTNHKIANAQVEAVSQTPSYVEFILHSVIDKNAQSHTDEKVASPLNATENKLGVATEGALH
jgi:Tfp pilus assembly protein PilN